MNTTSIYATIDLDDPSPVKRFTGVKFLQTDEMTLTPNGMILIMPDVRRTVADELGLEPHVRFRDNSLQSTTQNDKIADLAAGLPAGIGLRNDGLGYFDTLSQNPNQCQAVHEAVWAAAIAFELHCRAIEDKRPSIEAELVKTIEVNAKEPRCDIRDIREGIRRLSATIDELETKLEAGFYTAETCGAILDEMEHSEDYTAAMIQDSLDALGNSLRSAQRGLAV